MKPSAQFLVRSITAGLALFTATAFAQKGDPISPTEPKVTICHNIDNNPITITVAQSAVAAHLAHGDSLGPCASDANVTICHRGRTITVAQSAVQTHLDHGDSVGPCNSFSVSGLTVTPVASTPAQTPVAARAEPVAPVAPVPAPTTPVVNPAIAARPPVATPITPALAAPSVRVSPTPVVVEEMAICYKGHTVMVAPSAVKTYLSIGATIGRCPEASEAADKSAEVKSEASEKPSDQ